jgi:hypothetical protein
MMCMKNLRKLTVWNCDRGIQSNSIVMSNALPLNSDIDINRKNQSLFQQSKRSRVDRNKKNLTLPNIHEILYVNKKIEPSVITADEITQLI